MEKTVVVFTLMGASMRVYFQLLKDHQLHATVPPPSDRVRERETVSLAKMAISIWDIVYIHPH